MERVIEIVVLILLAMFSVRALVSLVAPSLHQRIVARFYRQSPWSAAVYLVLFVVFAGALIATGGFVVFGLALVTIGFLYDYLFALFPKESNALVRAGENDRARLWVFAYLVPFGTLVGIIVELATG